MLNRVVYPFDTEKTAKFPRNTRFSPFISPNLTQSNMLKIFSFNLFDQGSFILEKVKHP